MILLDTHIWVWLVDENERLQPYRQTIEEHRTEGLGISAISCWEVAKLVEYDRLKLACTIETWMDGALAVPNLHVVELTPQIAIESTLLPGTFHSDPADQMIVATARIHALDLLTADDEILKYKHVPTL